MIDRKLLKEILQGILSLAIVTFVIMMYFSKLNGIPLINLHQQQINKDLIQNSQDLYQNTDVHNIIQSNKTTDINPDTLSHIKNLDYYGHYINQNGSINRFAQPKERTIILRLDDVQGYLWNNISIRIIDTVLMKNMSITLGVIPGRHINEDNTIREYLLGKINDPRVELAQHGYVHTEFEFINRTEYDVYNLTTLGLEDMINILSVRPITFIPPDNVYDNNTTKVLSELGFKIISADQNEYKFDGNLSYIGYTIPTKHSDETDLVSTPKILESCIAALNKNHLCVIMIHPQDFVEADNKNLNDTKYENFVGMLDKLKGLNTKFATFRDLED